MSNKLFLACLVMSVILCFSALYEMSKGGLVLATIQVLIAAMLACLCVTSNYLSSEASKERTDILDDIQHYDHEQ